MNRRARLIFDGEIVEVELPADWLAVLEHAQRIASRKREHDLDRIIRAELARNPDATLDRLCEVARRNRQEVSRARRRVIAPGASEDQDEGLAGTERGRP